MAKYVYAAIFTEEDEGGYSINFPDFESCYTYSAGIIDGMEMAEDALCLTLYHFEKTNRIIPEASDIRAVTVPERSFVTYIYCNTEGYEDRVTYPEDDC